MSIASQIFKIRAHSDYISHDPSLLSFRAGQPFYALSKDLTSGTYFVSTQFAVPFSRSAVSGLVPIDCFDTVNLLARDPPLAQRRKTEIARGRKRDTLSETRKREAIEVRRGRFGELAGVGAATRSQSMVH
jgi:Variant SH3 domain